MRENTLHSYFETDLLPRWALDDVVDVQNLCTLRHAAAQNVNVT